MSGPSVQWLKDVEAKDYAAAEHYLTLLMPAEEVKRVVKRLRKSPLIDEFVAKDILRAARLPVLTAEESPEVAAKVAKVLANEAISPILLVSRPDVAGLVIADGYHRTCCALHFDEGTVVPCRVVHL
jgi:hypothetical protein